MRICFIVGAFPKMMCGVGDYTNKLAMELAKDKNNEIFVITSNKASNNFKNIKVFNIVDKWNKSSTKTIINKLKEIKPDVVNIQYPSDEYDSAFFIFIILPLMIKLNIKCKLTETIHEYEETLSTKGKIKFFFNFRMVQKIIVPEKKFVDFIHNDFKRVKVDFIRISSNIPRTILTKNEILELKKKLNISSDYLVSFFGFINRKKGFEKIIECLPKLKNTSLLLVRNLNESDEYQKNIIELIDKYNVKDKIIITGFLEKEQDVAKYLSISDVCVLPFTEGIQERNGSFLAAYNQLIPVITTGKDKNDENGIYYVKPGDEKELLNKITYVLKNKNTFDRPELSWATVAKEFLDSIK